MIFLVKYGLERHEAELFEYYPHTCHLTFLFVTEKEISTHYVAKGMTITCKITMGLIDLLRNNTNHREHQSIERDNISHN